MGRRITEGGSGLVRYLWQGGTPTHPNFNIPNESANVKHFRDLSRFLQQ